MADACSSIVPSLSEVGCATSTAEPDGRVSRVILPPQIFNALDCPFCRSPHAVFVDAEHQPAIFEKVIALKLDDRDPLRLAFVCGCCQVFLSPCEFRERVSQVIQIEQEQHRYWKRIAEALAA